MSVATSRDAPTEKIRSRREIPFLQIDNRFFSFKGKWVLDDADDAAPGAQTWVAWRSQHLHLYGYLAAMAGSNTKAWPKVKTIVRDLGDDDWSESKVRRCMHVLLQLGLLTIERQFGHGGAQIQNLYWIEDERPLWAGPPEDLVPPKTVPEMRTPPPHPPVTHDRPPPVTHDRPPLSPVTPQEVDAAEEDAGREEDSNPGVLVCEVSAELPPLPPPGPSLENRETGKPGVSQEFQTQKPKPSQPARKKTGGDTQRPTTLDACVVRATELGKDAEAIRRAAAATRLKQTAGGVVDVYPLFLSYLDKAEATVSGERATQVELRKAEQAPVRQATQIATGACEHGQKGRCEACVAAATAARQSFLQRLANGPGVPA